MESLRRGAGRRDAAKGLGVTAIKGPWRALVHRPSERRWRERTPFLPFHCVANSLNREPRSLAPSQYVAIQRIDFDTSSTVSLDIPPSALVAFSPEDAAVATVLSRVAFHPAFSRVCFAECYGIKSLACDKEHYPTFSRMLYDNNVA